MRFDCREIEILFIRVMEQAAGGRQGIDHRDAEGRELISVRRAARLSLDRGGKAKRCGGPVDERDQRRGLCGKRKRRTETLDFEV